MREISYSQNGEYQLSLIHIFGHYRIEEVNAPEGYTINKNYVEIAVDANTAYQMDSESGDAIITVDYENHPVKGKLTIYKKGEMLTGFK